LVDVLDSQQERATASLRPIKGKQCRIGVP
jgi:hypothetical protein